MWGLLSLRAVGLDVKRLNKMEVQQLLIECRSKPELAREVFPALPQIYEPAGDLQEWDEAKSYELLGSYTGNYGAEFPRQLVSQFPQLLLEASITVKVEVEEASVTVSVFREVALPVQISERQDPDPFKRTVRERDFVAERVKEIIAEVRKNPALKRKYELRLLDDLKTDWMHTKQETLSGYEMERLCSTLKQALKSMPKYKSMSYVKEPHKPQFEIGKRNEGSIVSEGVTWLLKQTPQGKSDPLETETNRLISATADCPTVTFKAKSVFQQSGRTLVQTTSRLDQPAPTGPKAPRLDAALTEPKPKQFVTKFLINDCRTMKAIMAKNMSLGTEPSKMITTFRDEVTPEELGKEDFMLSFKVQHEVIEPLEQRKSKVDEEAEVKAKRQKELEDECMLRTSINGRDRSEFTAQVRPAHREKQLGNLEPHALLDRELYKGIFELE
jgi:hypothetical protein